LGRPRLEPSTRVTMTKGRNDSASGGGFGVTETLEAIARS
jgi:hypothetical protein